MAFLEEALRGRRRILEVGCGHGHVARALGAAGFDVTALDVEQRDPRPAANVTYVESDFLAYDAGPFDAVLFTSSLHHITPLVRAIDHSAQLVAANGLLVVDDFDLDAPDAETLHWYYDLQALLSSTGLYHAHRIDPPSEDPMARWREGHAHTPPLHTGSQLRLAISERFVIRELRMVEYLHRYIGAGLAEDQRSAEIAAHVLETERRRIARGMCVPVGLRIVASLL